MPLILIIDDERSIRNTLKEVLEYEKYNVLMAENAKEARVILNEKVPDVVLCDIKMPGTDGMEFLHETMKENSEIPFIMITGHGDVQTAVDAIKTGAFDFIEKPLDLNRLLISVRNALDKSKLVKETIKLKKKVGGKYEMIGTSAAMQGIRDMIIRVAPTEAKVLITGENGTGKELVARAIHENSPRSKGEFVEVNCAAIPSELIESELFGHEKGSFTSAIKQRIGKFEQASGGTLFLDEIGDMSLAAQAKVLRALQESRITRVGGDKEIKVDVRVIAATNKNLKDEIAENRFREDLYHRLSVILIHVPSLNERKEDISKLTEYFVNQICCEYGMPVVPVANDAIKALQDINWTGNIREFRNVIERLIILSPAGITGKAVKEYARPLKS